MVIVVVGFEHFFLKFIFTKIKLLNMETILLFNFLGPEMFIIFFAILLLFGGKKIPELMRGVGRGIREFNTARSTLEQELKDGMNEQERNDQKKGGSQGE